MAFREVYRKGRHHYLYERESYWDPKLRKVRKRTLRYLGPCDARGRLRVPPSVRVDSLHSSFPVGPLAVLYAAARDLHVVDRVEGGCSRSCVRRRACSFPSPSIRRSIDSR